MRASFMALGAPPVFKNIPDQIRNVLSYRRVGKVKPEEKTWIYGKNGF